MKITKLFALLLALTLVFTLAACGNSNNNDPSGSQQGANAPLNREDDTLSTDNQGGENNPSNAGNIDIGSIMSGNGSTDTIYGQLDEASKQQIISDLAKDGYEASFGADGSMTIVDPDGTTMVQKPDGTWTIKDAEGNEGQVGGDWPDNEFTKLVPKPDFELYAASGDDTFFTVAFTNATIEGIRAYAEKLKAAGFTVDPEVMDTEMMGMAVYNYIASNGKGVSVTLAFSNNASALSFEKE